MKDEGREVERNGRGGWREREYTHGGRGETERCTRRGGEGRMKYKGGRGVGGGVGEIRRMAWGKERKGTRSWGKRRDGAPREKGWGAVEGPGLVLRVVDSGQGLCLFGTTKS
jgi:hypothetical protein